MKVEKKRYFYIQLYGSIPTKQQFSAELRERIHYIAGELAVAKSNVYVFQYENNSAYIRSTLETKDIVEIALIMCGLQQHYFLEIVKVSGTIKSLRSKLR